MNKLARLLCLFCLAGLIGCSSIRMDPQPELPQQDRRSGVPIAMETSDCNSLRSGSRREGIEPHFAQALAGTGLFIVVDAKEADLKLDVTCRSYRRRHADGLYRMDISINRKDGPSDELQLDTAFRDHGADTGYWLPVLFLNPFTFPAAAMIIQGASPDQADRALAARKAVLLGNEMIDRQWLPAGAGLETPQVITWPAGAE